MRIYEHVCYFDVNSATMYTVCTKHEPHDKFGEEFHRKHPGSAHLAIYNDPIHAKCDGAQSLTPGSFADLTAAVGRVLEAVKA